MATCSTLETQKAGFVGSLEGWSTERLNYRPGPGEWSALEMLDHIVKTEQAIQNAAVEGLRSPHRIGLADRLRTKFLESVFRSQRKVRVPASASLVLPDTDLDLRSILERWDGSREILFNLLESERPEILSRGIFKHPVGGWMGMPQIIDFFSVHLVHHEFQRARLERASSAL